MLLVELARQRETVPLWCREVSRVVSLQAECEGAERDATPRGRQPGQAGEADNHAHPVVDEVESRRNGQPQGTQKVIAGNTVPIPDLDNDLRPRSTHGAHQRDTAVHNTGEARARHTQNTGKTGWRGEVAGGGRPAVRPQAYLGRNRERHQVNVELERLVPHRVGRAHACAGFRVVAAVADDNVRVAAAVGIRGSKISRLHAQRAAGVGGVTART